MRITVNMLSLEVQEDDRIDHEQLDEVEQEVNDYSEAIDHYRNNELIARYTYSRDSSEWERQEV